MHNLALLLLLPPQKIRISPPPPNQIFVVGLSCGIVVCRQPHFRQWFVVICCHQPSLTRSAVFMCSSSTAWLLSLPTALQPSLPSLSVAPPPSPLPPPPIVGCRLLFGCPSICSCCPPPAPLLWSTHHVIIDKAAQGQIPKQPPPIFAEIEPEIIRGTAWHFALPWWWPISKQHLGANMANKGGELS